MRVSADKIVVMNNKVSLAVIAISVFAQSLTAQGKPRQVMTNATVEEMVGAGIAPDTIIQAVQTADNVEFKIMEYEYYQFIRLGASERASDQIWQAMKQRSTEGPRKPLQRSSSEIVPKPSPPSLSGPAPASLRPSRSGRPATSPSLTQTLPLVPKLYINQMEGQLDGFIAAELVKQRLNLLVVVNEGDADLALTGLSMIASNHVPGFVYSYTHRATVSRPMGLTKL
jgi:hypothetical protein